MDTMGGTQTLIERELEQMTSSGQTPTTSGSCPCCEEPWGGLPHADTRYFPDVPLRRCRRCGSRFVAESGQPRLLVSCAECSLPLLSDCYDHPTEQRCEDCRSGKSTKLSEAKCDSDLILAAEDEVRAALDEDCSFLVSPPMAQYLSRVARSVARVIEGAPSEPTVILIDDPGIRTLALPSGLIAVSIGALASLEDESELAFMLAHELAHAARGDAALRLIGQGLFNLARTEESVGDVWRAAVEDMLALGYGRRRELDADDRAAEAILELGFDPSSVQRWFSRLDRRISDADPHMRSYFLSHPTPSQRHRRLQQLLSTRVDAPGSRINREVFRRAAGREALSTVLQRVDRLSDAIEQRAPEQGDAVAARRLPTLTWLAIGVAITVAIVLAVVTLG